MSVAIPILTSSTSLYLSYLLTQLIYARTQSPQKGVFLFHRAWNMTNDCLCYENPDDGSKINDRGVQKKYIKSKGQCKDKYLKKNSYIFENIIELTYYSSKHCSF